MPQSLGIDGRAHRFRHGNHIEAHARMLWPSPTGGQSSCEVAGRAPHLLDLAFPEAMVAVEYDGRHHSEQWAQDSLRRFAIEASGWAYVQVIGLGFITDADKRHVAELVGRLIRERTGKNYL